MMMEMTDTIVHHDGDEGRCGPLCSVMTMMLSSSVHAAYSAISWSMPGGHMPVEVMMARQSAAMSACMSGSTTRRSTSAIECIALAFFMFRGQRLLAKEHHLE